MTRRIIHFFFFISLSLNYCFSQVSEVTARANAYKDRNSDTFSNDNADTDEGGGSLFLIDLFIGMMRPIVTGISIAQKTQLANTSNENWRNSFELKVGGGINFSEVDFFDSQMIRGNYGLFSTQLRRFNVNDVSGVFTTIDWQVIQLNLINTDRVRWVLGGGVSHEYQVDQSHFEWSTELYASFIQNKFMPFVTYRKSGDGYPREEFTTQLEYRPFRAKQSEFAFKAGYLHQVLYDVRFDFVTLGVSFYLK